MSTARATAGLAYPQRFHAAASYAGFDRFSNPSTVSSKFKNDVALLLYALYQQATVGPCNIPKPKSWSPVEQSKWGSWHELGIMPREEAMRLFVKILEEEDPGWYSRVSSFTPEPVADAEVNHNTKVDQIIENGNSYPQQKDENGSLPETQVSDGISEGFGAVSVYDQWVAPPISGPHPKARYEHGAAVINDKMYVFGGNHNGRYLSDLQALDLKSWTWSKVEARVGSEVSSLSITPCAGHSLIAWQGKLLSIGGHTKDPSDSLEVMVFDLQTSCWSSLITYGKPPCSRGGHSVTLVGSSLVIFGGEGAKRSLLSDLHILDLETLTWDEIETVGVPPSPRSDHAAAVHADRFLLIFGGGSHATCFNDLHVLDLQAMEWSRPTQQGDIPTARAGHAGAAVGENWFIVGGGDNKNGASETVVLNMSTLVWSVVTTVQGRVPLASEGLSLILRSYNGEDVLVSFGGYNGRYNNEVNVLKPSHKSTLQSKMMETHVPDSVSAVHNATNATRDIESEFEAGQERKTREVILDSQQVVNNVEETSELLITSLNVEKNELALSLNKEKLQTLHLKQELVDAETRNAKELLTVRAQLGIARAQLSVEQSRCFQLEVEVAELRQKLQTMETLQKELEILHRQKAASEQAALSAKRQSSGGVWSWLAGTPPNQRVDYE